MATSSLSPQPLIFSINKIIQDGVLCLIICIRRLLAADEPERVVQSGWRLLGASLIRLQLLAVGLSLLNGVLSGKVSGWLGKSLPASQTRNVFGTTSFSLADQL